MTEIDERGLISDGDFRTIDGESAHPSAQSDALDDWLLELGTDVNAEVRVYIDAGGGNSKKTFIFAYEPQDFNYVQLCEKLRDEYGGGTFRVICYVDNPNAKSKRGIAFNRTISVIKSASNVEEHKRPDEMAAVLDTMRQMQENNDRRFMELLEVTKQPAPPSVDIVGLVSAAAPVIGALKSLFQPPTPQTDPLEGAAKIVGLMKDLDIGGGGERNNADVILEGIKTLGAPIAEMMANQSQQQHHQPQQAQQPPRQQPVLQKRPTITGDKKNMGYMRMMSDLKRLTKAAEAGKDPGLYADFLLEEYTHDEMVRVATDPSLLKMAATMVPGMAAQEAWFAQVVGFIREAVIETEETDTALTGEKAGDINEPNEQTTTHAEGGPPRPTSPNNGNDG